MFIYYIAKSGLMPIALYVHCLFFKLLTFIIDILSIFSEYIFRVF
ncbi:putative membrane protein [Escherichia coli 1-392-07_S3_C1]|nr:putative membrane protein [Escherichia coli]EHV94540.1 putative membrane protein [Escherichia coli DEC7B]EMV90462.1 putative membrane protein [Escherichia coli 2865200]EYE37205.1 putative membrane protein [Escherichia coli 1-110-08_S1_C2]EZJ71276.1 putative membrane protein [Escherichia coli 1-392-07_S3_C3]KDT33492.1 putative membrane protein [Escherichia coli 3-105-05_S1_C1]KDU56441.1 putative membrane protein [Escherichia coli 3-475-03_S4_C2]KDW59912.1 putative membrane protein [Escheri